jgi:hypothetical protein
MLAIALPALRAPNAERPIHPRQIRARAIGKTLYQLLLGIVGP